jgi:hypothetical protein
VLEQTSSDSHQPGRHNSFTKRQQARACITATTIIIIIGGLSSLSPARSPTLLSSVHNHHNQAGWVMRESCPLSLASRTALISVRIEHVRRSSPLIFTLIASRI